MNVHSIKIVFNIYLFVIFGSIVCQNVHADNPTAAVLRERADILRNKITLCQIDLSQGAPDCNVVVNWENNRRVSIAEAENLIALYLKQAQKNDAASDVADWSGNWDKAKKELVRSALSSFKDKEIRDWITVNVRFELRADPGQQNQISPWAGNATLIFNNYYFSRDVTNARRENLIAFEAGKAFWVNKVAGNQTLNTWFKKYNADHLSLVRRLVNAKHQEEDLASLDDSPEENSSAFGYVFRAQALGLQLDKTAQHEFEVRIAPLLQGK